MGATYTRQSTYSDGDVITAAHTNDEFNQLLAAFASGTGHTHDGTSAEGGPITKLLGTSLTLGDGTAGTDITVTFDGETNDGVLKWMEDEDYFEFSDDILVASTEKLQFRDTALYINSSTDGQLDIVADTEIQLAATTVDLNGNLDVSGSLTIGGATLTSTPTELNLLDGVSGLVQADFTKLAAVDSTSTELNLVDGSSAGTIVNSKAVIYGSGGQVNATSLQIAGTDLTATATEFNLLDGGSTIGTTTVSDGHGILMNHGGTMGQTTVQTLAAYLDDEITAMPNLVSTGALNGGSITSGFGNIDTGSSTITTTGLITGGSLDIDDVVINGTTIGHTDDTDLITLADGVVTIAGDLTISGDDLTMGTNTSGHIMVADGANFNPVAVSGDVTISSAGAVTIASGAVETAMVNANVITGQSELSSAGVDITNDDLLIHDNDAGALKKVSVTNLISSAGGLTEVVADTTPQLGGNLDTNSHNILIDDAHFIADENGNEQIIFQTTASAVNQIDVTNAATGNAPEISATGGDTNISLKLTPKGSGQVLLDGNVGVESGVIDLKNSGSRSKINFYCESGNAHAQSLQAAPHSESASNTLTLPSTGGDVDLVSTASTATLTNKSIDSDNNTITNIVNADIKSSAAIADTKLATISTAGKVALSALEIDGASDIGADLADADLIIVDDGAGGTEVKSELTRVKKYIYSAMSGDATASDAGALTIANDAVESGMLNDNVISGQTELASGLADTDELMVSDAGTIKRMDMSVVKTYLTSAGFSTEDPTALAIALG